MRRLFGSLLFVLLGASWFTHWIQPERQSEVPILYWTTSPHGTRELELEGFYAWLEKHDYPKVEVRLDYSNNDLSKKMIQGLSGVGGDIIDLYADQLYMLQDTGMIADITEPAKEMGFSPDVVFPQLYSDLVIDGRQYGFPHNTGTHLYWVNVEAFEEAGMGIPPRSWTVDTFEEWGKRYMEARNPEGERRRFFFANTVRLIELVQSTGLAQYNETMTAATTDDPRFVMVLERIYKWMHEDHIIPTMEEESTFAVEGSSIGIRMSLFARGNYAMLDMGRYAVIRLRQYGEIEYAASFFPHFGYENAQMGGGAMAIYADSELKEHAYRIFQYIASEEHSRLVVETGDGVPVDPDFVETEAFLRPPEYPNEWRVHSAFAESAKRLGVPRQRSPFVMPEVMGRIIVLNYESFLAGRQSAEYTARVIEERTNEEIRRTLREREDLRPEYERRLFIQEKIDSLKAEGEPIPEEWIYNPFYLKYYRDTGQLEASGPAPEKE